MGLGQLLNRSTPVLARADTGGVSWRPSARVMPQPVSEGSALSVPAFWRGHELVTGTLGALPVAAWREIDRLDPQPAVLRQPDASLTPMAFWAGMCSSVTLYGNAFCIIVDVDRFGWPTQLQTVHPLQAAARFTGNPSAPSVGAWYLAGGVYDPGEVWHVRSHVGRPGSPLGQGLLDGVRGGISAAQALQDYRASFFASGAVPPGLIKVDRPEVSDAEADRLKASWIGRFAGTQEPAVLNSLTDFTPVAFNPVDSQMIEAAELSVKEAALMWGLPTSVLGAPAGSGTYRNAETDERAIRASIARWARLFEQAISISLLPRGQDARWDLDAALRLDTDTKMRWYQAALANQPWMLVDEVRGLEDMDPMAEAEADDEAPPDVQSHPVVHSGEGGPPAANPAALNGARP